MIYRAARPGFLLFTILFFGTLAQIIAGPGDLDPTFDNDGIAITDNGSGQDVFADLIIQPDGKIVAVGSSFNGTTQIIVARYNPDGSLDAAFGTGGKYIFPISAIPTCIALQADGKIVVGGHQIVALIGGEFPSSDFFVGRVNANGTLDTTFNGTGTRVFPMRGGLADDIVSSVKVQTDGKIVLGGISARNFSVYDYALARLNTDGSHDTAFDADGIVFTVLANEARSTSLGELAIQPDGKIVATGHTRYFFPDSGISDFAATTIRYNPDGSLDTGFDGDGIVTIQESGQQSFSGSLVILADGKILIAGSTLTGGNYNIFLVKYNTNGSLDTSFGTNGRSVPFGGFANDVVIQQDNKIVVSTDAGVGRFTANGSPDVIFSGDGLAAISPPNNTYNTVNAIALQSNGKIVIGGTTGINDDTKDFMVARLEFACTVNCSTKFADFDGDGLADISVFKPNGEWWIKRSSSSPIVYTFGTSTDKIVPGDYTGDGKADVAVFRPSTGEWFILRSEDNSYYAFPYGVSGDIPAPADFDGDGKTDPAVFRPSNGVWYIFLSSTGFTETQFGIAGDVPVAADYDGDTKADIAIFRPSNGEWWLRRSTAGLIATTFGGSADTPIAGDYTGDGKADIAFWRPSTGDWFVLRSENFSYYSFRWGIPGDFPAAADFDGDGKYDPTVFRPSNASWWVNKTTSGIVTTFFGSPGDKPVTAAFIP